MQNILILILSIFFFAGSPDKPSEEKKWPEELNTAKDAPYLTELEREVIHELNKVRSNPKRYAEEYLEELRSGFDGKLFTYPGQLTLRSQEGIRPLEECINVLNKTLPQPMLTPSEGLSKAAKDLMKDQQRYGGTGHISRKGATPRKRIEKYGTWGICSSEDITYGSFDARQIVIFLLIDDGVPNRGHRENVLNSCSRFAGVSKGGHPTYETMCVIDYAGDYKSK